MNHSNSITRSHWHGRLSRVMSYDRWVLPSRRNCFAHGGSGTRATRAFAQLRQRTWLCMASRFFGTLGCFLCPVCRGASEPQSPPGTSLSSPGLQRAKEVPPWLRLECNKKRLAPLPGGGACWQDTADCSVKPTCDAVQTLAGPSLLCSASGSPNRNRRLLRRRRRFSRSLHSRQQVQLARKVRMRLLCWIGV